MIRQVVLFLTQVIEEELEEYLLKVIIGFHFHQSKDHEKDSLINVLDHCRY